MSPEEQFDEIRKKLDRIEKWLETFRRSVQTSEEMRDAAVTIQLLEQQFGKHEDALGKLVLIAASAVKTAQENNEALTKVKDSISEQRELQKHTDETLNILIETVDRIIRHRGNGHE
jgi:hypothetical protein